MQPANASKSIFERKFYERMQDISQVHRISLSGLSASSESDKCPRPNPSLDEYNALA
jgi:hypothetical protein